MGRFEEFSMVFELEKQGLWPKYFVSIHQQWSKTQDPSMIPSLNNGTYIQITCQGIPRKGLCNHFYFFHGSWARKCLIGLHKFYPPLTIFIPWHILTLRKTYSRCLHHSCWPNTSYKVQMCLCEYMFKALDLEKLYNILTLILIILWWSRLLEISILSFGDVRRCLSQLNLRSYV